MALSTILGASIFPDRGRAIARRAAPSLILGLLAVALVPAMVQSSVRPPSAASARLTTPGPAPGGIPVPEATTTALEPDGDPEGDRPAGRTDSDGASGIGLVVSGSVAPDGARVRAVNLKFVTFVHVLRGQARATPKAGTRAPPLV